MSTYTDGHKGDTELDITTLFAALWRNKWWIILWMIVGLVSATAFLILTKPVYQADARLLIERRETVFTRPSDERNIPVRSDFDALSVASQVEVLRSRNLLQAVVTKLDLGSRAEFDPLLEASGTNPVSSLLSLLGLGGGNLADTREERVLASLYEKLKIYPVSESRVVSVEMVSEDPKLAADVANAITAQYLLLQREDSRANTLGASKFLEGEISDLRQRVADSERKVEEFRSSADLLSVDSESTLTKQRLSETLTLLSDVSAQRTEAEAKADQIRRLINSGAALDSSSDVQGSPLIQRLREQQVALRARIVDLQTSLLPSHPQVQAARSQLQDLEREISRQALLIARALEGDAEVAKVRQQELEQEVARLKTATGRANEQEVKLRALEREARSQRELLETYLTRFRESTARQNAEFLPVNAKVISDASAPIEKHFPKTVPTYGVAGFVGAFLASIFILAGELLSGRAFVQSVPNAMRGYDEDGFYDEPSFDKPTLKSRKPMSDEFPHAGRAREEDFEGQGDLFLNDDAQAERKPKKTWFGFVKNEVPATVVDDNYAMEDDDQSQEALIDGTAARTIQDTASSKIKRKMRMRGEVASNDEMSGQKSKSAVKSQNPDVQSIAAVNGTTHTQLNDPETTPQTSADNQSMADLYTIDDAVEAIERYKLEQISIIPVFRDMSCADLALDLSRLLAETGRSVVFIDTTNIEMDGDLPLTGVSDVMAGYADLDEAIFADPSSPVDLMAGGSEEIAAEDWEDGRSQYVLDTLSSNYDMTVLHEGQGTSVPYMNELIDRSDMVIFAVSAPISRRQVADVLRDKIGEVPTHSMFVGFHEEDDVAAA